MMDEMKIRELEKIAGQVRAATILEIGGLGVGHIGGAMSVIEVLVYLYFHRMRIDPANPHREDRDRFILSKGHAGPALYATLARRGFFPDSWLATLNRGGTRLPSHCDRTKTPGIDMTTGSLGQGFSAATGIALGVRMRRAGTTGSMPTVFAIIGDGECDEGQVWEAALFASHRKLGNLVAYTDCNRLQLDGPTGEVLGLEPLEDKWKAFGWFVRRVDGHDFARVDQATEDALRQSAGADPKPSMIILDTVKGKGCSFAEGLVSNHNMSFGEAEARAAVAALEQ